jgi:hypothetical protein
MIPIQFRLLLLFGASTALARCGGSSGPSQSELYDVANIQRAYHACQAPFNQYAQTLSQHWSFAGSSTGACYWAGSQPTSNAAKFKAQSNCQAALTASGLCLTFNIDGLVPGWVAFIRDKQGGFAHIEDNTNYRRDDDLLENRSHLHFMNMINQWAAGSAAFDYQNEMAAVAANAAAAKKAQDDADATARKQETERLAVETTENDRQAQAAIEAKTPHRSGESIWLNCDVPHIFSQTTFTNGLSNSSTTSSPSIWIYRFDAGQDHLSQYNQADSTLNALAPAISPESITIETPYHDDNANSNTSLIIDRRTLAFSYSMRMNGNTGWTTSATGNGTCLMVPALPIKGNTI